MKIKKISKKNRDVMYELIVPSLGQKKKKKEGIVDLHHSWKFFD